MPSTLFELGAPEKKQTQTAGTSIVSGVVISDCDPAMQAKVLVRIPSLNQEVWARQAAIGGGSGAGFFYTPRPQDEVVVALNLDDPDDAFILGGTWSTFARPPITTPVDVQTKRVIKTGTQASLVAGIGHEVVFDDLMQSITITTSMTPTGQQSITMDPKGIVLSNLAGTLAISLDNVTQSITIRALKGITLETVGQLKLHATAIDIQADAALSIGAKGVCTVSGKPIALN